MRELNKDQLNTVLSIINKELRENKNSTHSKNLKELNVVNSLRAINTTNTFKEYIDTLAKDRHIRISNKQAEILAENIMNHYDFTDFNNHITGQIKLIKKLTK